LNVTFYSKITRFVNVNMCKSFGNMPQNPL